MVETLPKISGRKPVVGLAKLFGYGNSGRKPVVGLAGFFGYGNYGDELFVSVFKEYFSDLFDLVFMSDLPDKPYYSRPIREVVAAVDAIIIGGGDIVQPWGMDPRYFSAEFLAKPIFVLGVGVPIRKVEPGSYFVEKEWVIEKYKAFFQHPSMKFVHARDQQSVRWIEEKVQPIVDVIEAPDIVCALTLPEATPPAGAPILGIVTRQRPGKEDDYSMINALAAQQRARGWAIRHIVLGTGVVGQRDLLDAADITGEKELVVSDALEDLSRAIGECRALVSMKFHGTVVATMYGVPSTVLITTSKNRNFMKRIDRSELVAGYLDPKMCERFDPAPLPIAPEKVDMLRTQATTVLTQAKQRLIEVLTEAGVMR